MKKCRICEEFKPLDEFHNRTVSPDGKNSACKLCKNEHERDMRYARRYNKDSILLKGRTFKTLYPDVHQGNFYCWVYRNTEYTSLKNVFGEELFQLVLRFIGREGQRGSYKKGVSK